MKIVTLYVYNALCDMIVNVFTVVLQMNKVT